MAALNRLYEQGLAWNLVKLALWVKMLQYSLDLRDKGNFISLLEPSALQLHQMQLIRSLCPHKQPHPLNLDPISIFAIQFHHYLFSTTALPMKFYGNAP